MFKKPQTQDPTCHLFVGNTRDLSTEQLGAVFAPHGAENVVLLASHAFVSFKTPEAASQALQCLRNRPSPQLGGRLLPLLYAEQAIKRPAEVSGLALHAYLPVCSPAPYCSAGSCAVTCCTCGRRVRSAWPAAIHRLDHRCPGEGARGASSSCSSDVRRCLASPVGLCSALALLLAHAHSGTESIPGTGAAGGSRWRHLERPEQAPCQALWP